MRNTKQWSVFFRAFGNPHRLDILKMLAKKEKMSVTEIAERLGITLKNTSRNLAILSNLDLVDFQGKQGQVFYHLNTSLDDHATRILKMIFN